MHLLSTKLIEMAQKMGSALQLTESLVWTKSGKDSKSKPSSAAATRTPGAPLGSNLALGQAMSSAASYNKNIQLPAGRQQSFSHESLGCLISVPVWSESVCSKQELSLGVLMLPRKSSSRLNVFRAKSSGV